MQAALFPGPLAELKKTNREKDYAVIGELARRMREPRSQLLYSRSARDLLRLATEHAELIPDLVDRHPVLGRIGEGIVVERAEGVLPFVPDAQGAR